MKKTGIYVLQVDSSPKPFFYVGKANDIVHRIKQHADGKGAYCIAGEPFTQIDPITKGIIDFHSAVGKQRYLLTTFEIKQEVSTIWSHGSVTRC